MRWSQQLADLHAPSGALAPFRSDQRSQAGTTSAPSSRPWSAPRREEWSRAVDRRVTRLEHRLLIRGSFDAYRPPMDTTASPRVLVIGFDPYRVPGPWDPEPVARAIEAGLARFAEHGVGVETCLFGLDGSDDVEAVVGD